MDDVELTICVTARVTICPAAWAAVYDVPLEDVADDVLTYVRDKLAAINDLITLVWK